MNQDSYSKVPALLNDYIGGLYRLDIALLRDTFSPTAQYATVADGSPVSLSIDEYFKRLEQRAAPVDQGESCTSRVISIRFAGEDVALAEIESSLFGHDYTDYLSLLRIDGRWRIQAKVFKGVPHPITEVNSCHT